MYASEWRSKVYSVDVGHGQLAWKLRNDERVVCMEKTNFRYMVREDIQDDLDFASVDVSFISLTKILGPAYNLLKTDAQMVCLIKPQFEAGKEKVGKKGVVREPSVHREVIEMVMDYASALDLRFCIWISLLFVDRKEILNIYCIYIKLPNPENMKDFLMKNIVN